MTRATLHRHDIGENATMGGLSIDGKFFGYTLENTKKRVAVGNYAIIFSYSPTWTKHLLDNLSKSYSHIEDILVEQQFFLPEIVVPGTHRLGNRDQCLFHPANKWSELLGCVAPGDSPLNNPDGDSSLLPSSRQTFSRLYVVLHEQMKHGSVALSISEDVPFRGVIDVDALHTIS